MSAPINATTDASGLRWYEFNGQKLLSATSLRRVLGMGFGLHNWVIGQVIDGAVMLRDDAEAQAMNEADYRKALRRAAVMKRDAAANLGTSVHEAAEYDVKAASLSDADARKPFLLQYESAQKALGFEPLVNECQVFNLTLGYAGSLDLIAVKDGRYHVVDIKTGKGMYNDHALQLALYYGAEFVGGYDPLDDKDVVYEAQTDILKKVESTSILHLQPNSFEWVEVPITDELAAAAVDLTRLAHWYANHPTIDSLRA